MRRHEWLRGDILPGGYILMRSTRDVEGWPKGWYGLVRSNDPDFVWCGRMEPDPLGGMTDKEISGCSKRVWNASSRWWRVVEGIEKSFKSDVMTSYDFVSACKRAGYRIKRDGMNVVAWFVGYVGQKTRRGIA